MLVFNNQTNKSYSYKKYVCRNELIAKEIPITWIYADRHKQSIFLNNKKNKENETTTNIAIMCYPMRIISYPFHSFL